MVQHDQNIRPLTDLEFRKLRNLVYRESGITLGDHKKSLVISRLSKRLRALNLHTFSEYYRLVTGSDGKEELVCMLDHLSTNKTEFFREPNHFNFLSDVFLKKIDRDRRIRIWSAACSSGEEPYSIAMTLYDRVEDPYPGKYKILASDLSTQVLKTAEAGVYDIERLQGLADSLVKRHFLKGFGKNDGKVKVKPHLLNNIVFRRINLMANHYPIKSQFDVIFCRNVMIYFDRRTQEQLIRKLYQYLKDGGLLFTGHSESLSSIRHQYRTVAPTIYQKLERSHNG